MAAEPNPDVASGLAGLDRMAAEPNPDVASGFSRTIVLASRSPRRAELLAAAGIPFEVLAADIDETPREGETPEAYVERLAVEKARAVLGLRPDADVLAADTTVTIDGLILGKPVDDREATEMLQRLRGRVHEVFTGVALVNAAAVQSAVERTRVWFSPMTDEDISWYVASGEPVDRAGAYAIQGLASRFIPRIEGSYSNVVGLPVALVSSILKLEKPLRLSL
ncbi:MAG: nucleoside triphosphate pyrophosphatase [Vicinamibacterales bacterium]